jgi:hypothetical protein
MTIRPTRLGIELILSRTILTRVILGGKVVYFPRLCRWRRLLSPPSPPRSPEPIQPRLSPHSSPSPAPHSPAPAKPYRLVVDDDAALASRGSASLRLAPAERCGGRCPRRSSTAAIESRTRLLADDAPAAFKVSDPGTVAAMECFYRPRLKPALEIKSASISPSSRTTYAVSQIPISSHLICCIFIMYQICCYFCDNLG